MTFRSLGKKEESIEYYDKAIGIDPYFSDCYFNLGNLYLDSLEFVAAERLYKKSLFVLFSDQRKSLVQPGKIYNQLSELYLEMKRLKTALLLCLRGIYINFLYLENYELICNLMENFTFSNKFENYFKNLNYLFQEETVKDEEEFSDSIDFIKKNFFEEKSEEFDLDDLENNEPFFEKYILECESMEEEKIEEIILATCNRNIKDFDEFSTSMTLEENSDENDFYVICCKLIKYLAY